MGAPEPLQSRFGLKPSHGLAADGTETTMDPVNDTETNLESTATAAEQGNVAVATAEASPATVTVTTGKLGARELIAAFEAAQLKSDLPEIYVGDTVRVGVRIREGSKERIQPYEGVVIAKRHGGLNETITVRRIFQGVGVERVFMGVFFRVWVSSGFSCCIAPRWPTSRLSDAVKCVGRSSSICVTGWVKPLA